jgi:hypothetical protein
LKEVEGGGNNQGLYSLSSADACQNCDVGLVRSCCAGDSSGTFVAQSLIKLGLCFDDLVSVWLKRTFGVRMDI